jgi:hypothetical protein
MRAQIIAPSPTILGSTAGIVREPTRPLGHRIEGFDQKFDFTTLFYDAFFVDGRHEVILVAPPFANLLPIMEDMVVTALPQRARCRFRIKSMDRHSQAWIDVPAETIELTLDTKIGRFNISPCANLSKLFEGKRVLFTLSKNNRIEWIEDWIRYNRDIHGADAVLLYDNASTAYTTAELLDRIGKIFGIDRTCIVSWPFKYGPLGFGLLRHWDSNFCQYGALEHARWMFLQRARSALNSDIDELVVSSRGRRLFEAAERSLTGMVAFHGVWVYGFADTMPSSGAGSPIRFIAFDHYLKPREIRRYGIFRVPAVFPQPDGMLNTKWAVVPARCPRSSQWAVHDIYGWRGMYTRLSIDGSLRYRHYREINDNWRDLTDNWQFSRAQREPFDPVRFAYDDRMVSNLSRVRWAE